MSLEDRIAALTTKVEELSTNITTLTAAIVGLIEAQGKTSPAAGAEPAKRPRRTKAQIEADEAAATSAPNPSVVASEEQAPLHTTEPAVGAGPAPTGGEHVDAPAASEPAPAPREATQDELKDALIGYIAWRVEQSKETDPAKVEAVREEAKLNARTLLRKFAGCENVSGCPADKRSVVIDIINQSKAGGGESF